MRDVTTGHQSLRRVHPASGCQPPEALHRAKIAADRTGMFWWFERKGTYLRCEVLQLPSGEYELRLVGPDGSESIEQFSGPEALGRRQQAVQQDLAADGWSGPHGWVL